MLLSCHPVTVRRILSSLLFGIICLQVFINPEVAALPEHHHLFAEGGHGCFDKHVNIQGQGRRIQHRPCQGKSNPEESKIPETFLPVKLTSSMDEAWEKSIFGKSSTQKTSSHLIL